MSSIRFVDRRPTATTNVATAPARMPARRILFAALATIGLGAGSALASLTQWNLVVNGDLFSNSEVEGSAFIGGNLNGPASNYATMLNAGQYAGLDTLVVGGNMNAGNVNLQAGNARVGGAVNGNINFNGGGSLILDPTVSAIASSLAAEMTSTSAYLLGLAANSTVQIPGGQPAAAVFNANPDANGLAIFNIDGALFSNPFVQQIDLNANGATSIIVNVSGTNVNYNTGNFVGAWNTDGVRATTVWNFHEATSIDMDRAFNGAILAPMAHLTNSTILSGAVWVDSFDQKGEVHLPFFTGVIPTPGTLVAMLVAGFAARRGRRRSA